LVIAMRLIARPARRRTLQRAAVQRQGTPSPRKLLHARRLVDRVQLHNGWRKPTEEPAQLQQPYRLSVLGGHCG
jgi:hypothetical protein